MTLGQSSNFVYIQSIKTAQKTGASFPNIEVSDLGALVVSGGVYIHDNLFVNSSITTSNTITAKDLEATTGYIKSSQLLTFNTTPALIVFTATVGMTPVGLTTVAFINSEKGYVGYQIATVTVYPNSNVSVSLVMPSYTNIGATAQAMSTTNYTCTLKSQVFVIKVFKNGSTTAFTTFNLSIPSNTVKFSYTNNSINAATGLNFGFNTGSTSPISFTPDLNTSTMTNDVYEVFISTTSQINSSLLLTKDQTSSTVTFSSVNYIYI
jgi:hypothetical protein